MNESETERKNEMDWAKDIVEIIECKLKEMFPDRELKVGPEKELLYAYEIKEYEHDGNDHHMQTMKFKTDILIFEELPSKYPPAKPGALVCEPLKVSTITDPNGIYHISDQVA